MDFWPDGADKGQVVTQDFIPVLPEVGLKDAQLLLGVLLHFRAAAAVGAQLPWPGIPSPPDWLAMSVAAATLRQQTAA